MLDQLQHLFEGVAWTTVAVSVVGGGAVVFLAYEHGWPWVKAKFQAITGKTSNAIAQIEDLVHFKVEDVHVRVDDMHAHLSATEADVLALTARVASLEHVAKLVALVSPLNPVPAPADHAAVAPAPTPIPAPTTLAQPTEVMKVVA